MLFNGDWRFWRPTDHDGLRAREEKPAPRVAYPALTALVADAELSSANSAGWRIPLRCCCCCCCLTHTLQTRGVGRECTSYQTLSWTDASRCEPCCICSPPGIYLQCACALFNVPFWSLCLAFWDSAPICAKGLAWQSPGQRFPWECSKESIYVNVLNLCIYPSASLSVCQSTHLSVYRATAAASQSTEMWRRQRHLQCDALRDARSQSEVKVATAANSANWGISNEMSLKPICSWQISRPALKVKNKGVYFALKSHFL